MKDYLLYSMLEAELRYHKYLYYTLAQPEMSDGEYDRLESRLNCLSKKNGWPSSWVGCRDRAKED